MDGDGDEMADGNGNDVGSSNGVFELVIMAADLTAVTGHHTITARIDETAPDGTVTRGVPETHGIQLSALGDRFAGSIEAWRESVGQELLERHINRRDVQAQILTWQGKRYPISRVSRVSRVGPQS